MKRKIRKRPGVITDTIDLADYISRDSVDAALRFLANVESTYDGLLEMPGKGGRCEFTHPRLEGLRSYPVKGFPNHLIFYRSDAEGIEIVAVLHGARDLPKALAERME